MMSLNISLPDTMRAFIDEQVKSGDYGTASEYLRELIREDQKQKAEKELEALLLEGLASGAPMELTPEDWNHIRQEVRRRAA
jgi:antitoxin ParD1/3/4